MSLAQTPLTPLAVLVAPLTAFTAALVLNWWLPRTRLAALTLDHPNRRSLHGAPIPRTGGVGLFGGALLALVVAAPALPAVLWIAVALLFAVSLANDIREVPPLARLAVHLAAAAAYAAHVLAGHGLATQAVVTLAAAWMANLYNFMDGSDGLAGGMAAIGFSFYGAAAAAAGSPGLALAGFSIAAAAAAFLVFNFHPARIFMGDAGSVPLGFLAAALGALGWVRGDWTWWFPALVFSPFIADASVTLARRLLAGEKVWRAHRDHYYQRLVQLGWGHRRTALAAYVLMAGCGLLALAALAAPAAVQGASLAAAAGAYLGIFAAIERRWRARRAAGQS
ncbi:MAG: glycosyltransferase family 4 protein [Burkholderiales bacterium]|nr:glycosyltransferase family 4 protein [Burkholderiales bacterium]